MTDDPEITDPRDPHKRRDIVAELDRWLRVYHFAGLIDVAVIQRARDEIVGLRGLLEHSDRTVITAVVVATPAIRDEALEEAARVCELSAEIMQPDERRLGDAIAAVKSCAAAIRKLKERA